MLESTKQALRDAYARPQPFPTPRPQRQRTRRPRAGDLEPGDALWWVGRRVTILKIDVVGYGRRRHRNRLRLRLLVRPCGRRPDGTRSSRSPSTTPQTNPSNADTLTVPRRLTRITSRAWPAPAQSTSAKTSSPSP